MALGSRNLEDKTENKRDSERAREREMSLPESCISHILSFTSPRDVSRWSLVSRIFFSAADSDTVWEKFLPSNYQDIISKLASSSSLTASLSKKDLFLLLCNHHLLIDDRNKSFALDKWSGKNCYMIGARGLSIIWGDTPEYWRWRSLSDSRFSEVAELVSGCWLEIHGKMETRMLSPKTNYGAYIVIKFVEGNSGLDRIPAEVSLKFLGGRGVVCTHSVFFDPDGRQYRTSERLMEALRNRAATAEIREVLRNRAVTQEIREVLHNRARARGRPLLQRQRFPRERRDGWLEIEMGDFFNDGGEDGEVEMSLMEVRGGHCKSGLIIQGIELRPKETRLNVE